MKVIIVDDERPLLNELEKMLGQQEGIDVVGAYTDPLEAFREAEYTKPDAAFLDIEMRGLNGIDLAKRLLRKLPELDIIFVTAFNHYATEAFEANAVDYLLKPIRPERLNKALKRLGKKRGEALPKPKELLRIQSFGKFGVYIGDKAIKWSRSKQRELLAYLLQNEGRWIDKYKICDDLWRDSPPAQALANLQTAVWAIRKVFRDASLSCVDIEFANDSYILSLKETQWDLRQFDAAYQIFFGTGDLQFGRKALSLYHDGYLFCEDWPWTALERGKYAVRQEKLKNALSGIGKL